MLMTGVCLVMMLGSPMSDEAQKFYVSSVSFFSFLLPALSLDMYRLGGVNA